MTGISQGVFYSGKTNINIAILHGCIYFPCVKLIEKSMDYWQTYWCESSGTEILILQWKPLSPGSM